MGVEKALLNVAMIAQSASLANNSLRLLNKKKKKANDFVRVGVQTIVGSAILKEEADFIGKM